MSASHSAEPSALRTGLGHLALSLGAFSVLAGAGAGAVYLFGDETAGAPKVEIALYSAQAGPPPMLKNRLDPSLLEVSLDEPSLGVEYEDGHAPADAAQTPGFKIIEIASNASAAPEVRSPLPKSPIAGYFERTSTGELPKIGPDGRRPADVYARPFAAEAGAPRVSLIVGGLGLNRNHTQAAIDELPPEVTLAFVPYAKDLQLWINRARAAGHEVLLEAPMEAYDYPNVDSGAYTLTTSASPEENLRRLNLLLGKATGYVGLTNYQGAKFATDARAAGPVFAALQQRGLIFVHDGAAARSTLPDAAKDVQLGFSIADRIADTEPSADAIDGELLQLEALAIQNGRAMGVGYAYPVTIEQFRLWTETLKANGYQLAPASTTAGVRVAPPAPEARAALPPGSRSDSVKSAT